MRSMTGTRMPRRKGRRTPEGAGTRAGARRCWWPEAHGRREAGGDDETSRGRRRRGGEARGARQDLGGLRTGGGLARGGAGTGRGCSRMRERGRVWIRGGFIFIPGREG
jgi:hypothetical protein